MSLDQRFSRLDFKGKKRSPIQTKARARLKFFLSFILIFSVILILGLTGIFIYFSKDLPTLTKIEARQTVQPSRIYDRTGKILLFEIKGQEERILVPLSEISPYLQKATVAVEDANFYHHFGLDFKSILRAIIHNAKVKLGLTKKIIIQGGSTITQQVIKNTLLTPERTLARKIKEAILAIELELRYSKDQILEIYLNQVSYGLNAYGVEAASRLYFGKSAKELSLAESAILASLPKAPTRLSPFGSHLDELKARQEYILERMAELKFISEEEKEKAKRIVPVFAPKFTGIKAPHFVMYVKEELEKNYSQEVLKRGGLKIFTTLDWELQQIAEKILKESGKRNEKFKAFNSALVTLDPKTGQILAMVGSKDYFGQSFPQGCLAGKNCLFDPNVNVAIRERQPGSVFKPFVYAKAFQKGYTPKTIIFDVKTEFNPDCPATTFQEKDEYGLKCYHPKNYDGKFRGPVTIKEALAQSLNVPSVKILYLTGIKDSIELAKSLGITTLNQPESHYGLSLVLGGGEVKLLDLVSAFSVFATNGLKNEKTAILKIENQEGKILKEFKPEPKLVLEENIAYLINDILADNQARAPIFGEHSPLKLEDRPAAVKTGTSQDYRDTWTVGYTPSLVCGVWVGNNDNTPIEKKPGAYIAAPIWNEFMREAYKVKAQSPKPKAQNNGSFYLSEEIEEFIKPEIELTGKPILDGEFIQKITLKIDKISGKLATNLTPPETIEEKTFNQVHSILFYVQKDNPMGENPSNPFLDPQYKNWEEGISAWLKISDNPFSKNFNLEEAPVEYDDIHQEENLPKILVFFPLPGTILKSNTFLETKISLEAPLGLEKIDYFIDENLISTRIISGNKLEIQNSFLLPETLEKKEYLFRIKVQDIAKNQTIEEIPIIIE